MLIKGVTIIRAFSKLPSWIRKAVNWANDACCIA
jgi:hypothetical protein